MRIDEKSTVPLGWVFGGFAAILITTVSVTIAGTVWVSTVNFRLKRIEEKLGIPVYQTQVAGPIENAFAESEGKTNASAKRLPESLPNMPSYK